jgi:uncharacterized Zn finger protein
MARWHEFGYYPPSLPREAKGGIKAQSKRGAFVSSWWAQRWIATLESFPIGARLGRGRSYARKGQVISLEIYKGRVAAEVQGSRRRPYAVSITMKPIAKSKWRRIAKEASENLLVAAKLMAGEMPPEIEQVFADVRAPLFPTNEMDLTTGCSCPDWSNPCKHVAAVYYLLAEAFDRDPFLLFRLRGMERHGLVALLGLRGTTGDEGTLVAEAQVAPADPLTTDPEAFWSAPKGYDELLKGVAVPGHPVPMASHLGGFPFWRGEKNFASTVSEINERAVRNGLRTFTGDWEIPDNSE